MNMNDGHPLDELDHIRQSIIKIVTTPIGSRVMRRDYGSMIPELIDAPINDRIRLLVMAATATAVIKWEPRVRPAKTSLIIDGATMSVELTASVKSGPAAGQTISMFIPLK
jgi:phage baseplate assembly protein W